MSVVREILPSPFEVADVATELTVDWGQNVPEQAAGIGRYFRQFADHQVPYFRPLLIMLGNPEHDMLHQAVMNEFGLKVPETETLSPWPEVVTVIDNTCLYRISRVHPDGEPFDVTYYAEHVMDDAVSPTG